MHSVMRSKIHKATVTQANLDYIGPTTIEEILLMLLAFGQMKKYWWQVIHRGRDLRLIFLSVNEVQDASVLMVQQPI